MLCEQEFGLGGAHPPRCDSAGAGAGSSTVAPAWDKWAGGGRAVSQEGRKKWLSVVGSARTRWESRTRGSRRDGGERG